ncbi:MAG: acetylglutamate kinase [Candidatus Omnitrophica bacterium]|nr:acetylglutamate kinase [Candidatus Omnitrophota bacterium]MBU0895458.1 acetylglutamate kinase [Candidatus Omnitrophota bacterium]MBU1038222.1 acetylglutamate kinase [Candidatus Omnitrophota bacterium]MBU1808419.1 acetylglutamate kinase [Candidatus Omnitrophota bacterium]
MKEAIKKSEVLIEALPHIKKFFEKTIVIKYGGSSVDEKGIDPDILEDIMFMNYAGMRPVIVHGGGPYISRMMKKAGIEPKFIDGRRYTDNESLVIIERALAAINGKIVKTLKGMGAKAFGISGRENGLIRARKIRSQADLGYVGEVTSVDTTVIKRLIRDNMIPVIYPLGIGRDHHAYNVNADDVASEIAVALNAEKFVLLTNVRGILRDRKDPSSFYNTLRAVDAEKLIKRRIIDGGMIPKALSCISAIKGGVKKAHILDAAIPHALLLEIFTDQGIGTEVVR